MDANECHSNFGVCLNRKFQMNLISKKKVYSIGLWWCCSAVEKKVLKINTGWVIRFIRFTSFNFNLAWNYPWNQLPIFTLTIRSIVVLLPHKKNKYKNKKITENDPLYNKRLISSWYLLRAYINGSVTSQSNPRDKNKLSPSFWHGIFLAFNV